MNIEWEILARVVKGKASDTEKKLFEKWYDGSSEQKSFINDVYSFIYTEDGRKSRWYLY